MSGITKYDKLKPVITLVIYWSAEPWDGPRTLSEMFVPGSEIFHDFAGDYKVNLLVPNEISNTDKFSTSLGTILEFIKISKDKDALSNFMINKRDFFSSLSIDDAKIIAEFTNTKLDLNCDKEASIDMCKAIEDMMMDAKMEEREIAIRNMLKKLSTQEIIDLGYEEELVNRIAAEH